MCVGAEHLITPPQAVLEHILVDRAKCPRRASHTSGLRVAGVLACLVAWTPFRWSVLQILWMGLCGGTPYTFDALEPMFHKYAQFEMDYFPSLFAAEQDLVIIEAEDYTWQTFVERTNGLTRPAKVRGIFLNTTAVDTWHKQEWADAHSDFETTNVKNKNAALKTAKGAALEDQSRSEFVVMKDNFGDLMNKIRSGEYAYSFGLDELFERYPSIAPDLQYDRLGGSFTNTICRTLSLFASSEGPGIAWHSDGAPANLVTGISGWKRWSMIDAKYSWLVGPRSRGDYVFSVGFSTRAPKAVIDQLPKVQFETFPGDAMFIPPWWFHLVDSFQTGPEPVMLATCRWSQAVASMRADWVSEIMQPFGVRNWLQPSMPEVALYIPGFRFAQELWMETFGTQPIWSEDQCFTSRMNSCSRMYERRGWEVKDDSF